jgi:hypothetical protein
MRAACDVDRLLTGRGVDVVEDLPELGLHLGLGSLGHLGEHVARSMNETPLAEALGEDDLGGTDEPRCPVGDDEQRWDKAAAGQVGEEANDMFTVRRLGASDRLARSLSCTNAVESMISTVRLVSSGVKRWRDPAMVHRWVGTGMIEAQRSFRRIKGCRDMQRLVDAVHAEVARRLADEEVGVVTPVKYDQAAA